MADVAIIGASLAGVRCAEALRRLGHDGSLVVVGDEPDAPYDRPPLSKGLLTRAATDDEVRLDATLGGGVDLRLGVAATALDTVAQEVELSDGSRLGYGRLVIATGSRPRELPWCSAENVLTLRSLDDGRRLRDMLRTARHVSVVGAGFVGLEVAFSCRALGLDVTVVEAASHPLARVLPATLAERVHELATAAGIELLCGRSVVAMHGSPMVRSLELSDHREHPADVVVVAVGAAPNTEWLESSGLTLDDGVVCDRHCVAADRVYAAGDVARWWHEGLGQSLRIEHWTNAVEQAQSVAHSIVHGAAALPYVPVPYFWSDLGNAKLQLCGVVDASDEVEVVEDDRDSGRFLASWERDGEFAGAIAINRPARLMALKRRMGARWATELTADV